MLALPRSENFKGFFYNKKTKKHNNFSTRLEDLFIFHTLESEIVSFIKTLDISFSFNTINDEEKFFILTYYKLPLIIK